MTRVIAYWFYTFRYCAKDSSTGLELEKTFEMKILFLNRIWKNIVYWLSSKQITYWKKLLTQSHEANLILYGIQGPFQ